MAQDYIYLNSIIEHQAYDITAIPDENDNTQIQRDFTGRVTSYHLYQTQEFMVTLYAISYGLEQSLWALYQSSVAGTELMFKPLAVADSGTSYTVLWTGDYDCEEIEGTAPGLYNLTMTLKVVRVSETIVSSTYNTSPSENYLKEIGYRLGETGEGKRVGIRPRWKVFVNRSLWTADPSADGTAVDLTNPGTLDTVLSIGAVNMSTDPITGATTASDTVISLSNENNYFDTYFDYSTITAPPTNPTWIGKIIQVWSGVRFTSGAVEYIPRFTGKVTNADFDLNGRVVKIHCLDYIRQTAADSIGKNLVEGLTVSYYNTEFASNQADWSGTTPIAVEDGKTMDTQQFLWGANKPHSDVDSFSNFAVDISGRILIDHPNQNYIFTMIKEASDHQDNFSIWVQDTAITPASDTPLSSSWSTDTGTFTFYDTNTAKRWAYIKIRYTTYNGSATARKIYLTFRTDGISDRALEGYTYSSVTYDTYGMTPQFWDNENPAKVILDTLKFAFAGNMTSVPSYTLTEAALGGTSADADTIWFYVDQTSYNTFYSDCDALGLYITDWIKAEIKPLDKINEILAGISGTMYSRGNGKLYFRLSCPRIYGSYIPTFKEDKNLLTINYSVNSSDIKNVIKISYNRDFYNDRLTKTYVEADTDSIGSYKQAQAYDLEVGVINDDATIQVLADQIKERLKHAYPVYSFSGSLSMLPLYVRDIIKLQYTSAGASTTKQVEVVELNYDIMNNTVSGKAVIDFFGSGSYAICGDDESTEAQGYAVWRQTGTTYKVY